MAFAHIVSAPDAFERAFALEDVTLEAVPGSKKRSRVVCVPARRSACQGLCPCFPLHPRLPIVPTNVTQTCQPIARNTGCALLPSRTASRGVKSPKSPKNTVVQKKTAVQELEAVFKRRTCAGGDERGQQLLKTGKLEGRTIEFWWPGEQRWCASHTPGHTGCS